MWFCKGISPKVPESLYHVLATVYSTLGSELNPDLLSLHYKFTEFTQSRWNLDPLMYRSGLKLVSICVAAWHLQHVHSDDMNTLCKTKNIDGPWADTRMVCKQPHVNYWYTFPVVAKASHDCINILLFTITLACISKVLQSLKHIFVTTQPYKKP